MDIKHVTYSVRWMKRFNGIACGRTDANSILYGGNVILLKEFMENDKATYVMISRIVSWGRWGRIGISCVMNDCCARSKIRKILRQPAWTGFRMHRIQRNLHVWDSGYPGSHQMLPQQNSSFLTSRKEKKHGILFSKIRNLGFCWSRISNIFFYNLDTCLLKYTGYIRICMRKIEYENLPWYLSLTRHHTDVGRMPFHSA